MSAHTRRWRVWRCLGGHPTGAPVAIVEGDDPTRALPTAGLPPGDYKITPIGRAPHRTDTGAAAWCTHCDGYGVPTVNLTGMGFSSAHGGQETTEADICLDCLRRGATALDPPVDGAAQSWMQDDVSHTLIPLPEDVDTDLADTAAALVERHLRTLFGDRLAVSVIDTSTDKHFSTWALAIDVQPAPTEPPPSTQPEGHMKAWLLRFGRTKAEFFYASSGGAAFAHGINHNWPHIIACGALTALFLVWHLSTYAHDLRQKHRSKPS